MPKGTPEPSGTDADADASAYEETPDRNLYVGMRVTGGVIRRLYMSPNDGEQHAVVKATDGTESDVLAAELRAAHSSEPKPEAADVPKADHNPIKDITDDEEITEPDRDLSFEYDSFTFRRGFAPEEPPPATPSRTAEPTVAEHTEAEAHNRTKPSTEGGESTPTVQSYLIPASHWPDDTCEEHDGQGWEVTVCSRRGKWSLCRFAKATTDDGRPYVDVWRPHTSLIPLHNASGGNSPETEHGEARRMPPETSVPMGDLNDPNVLGPPEDGVGELTPTHDTAPHVPGADPIKEPSRPKRTTKQPDRFTVSAIAASHLELQRACRNGDRLHVDVGQLSERLAQRAGLASIESGFDFDTNITELSLDQQRAICLLADHDDIVAELGASSPQAKVARELYALAAFDASRSGSKMGPLDPLLSAIRRPRSYTGESSLTECECDLPSIFDESHDGALFIYEDDGIDLEVVCAAKVKSSPEIFTEREMRGKEWDDPKQVEMGKLERLGAMSPIAADDPIIKDLMNKTPNWRPVDTMWAGRIKYKADLTIDKYSARCVLRGDIHCKTYGIDANRSTCPVVRTSSSMAVDACAAIRGMHMCPYDVTGAYLWGEQKECEQVIARPPLGFRQFDERGIEIYWIMWVPLYGQTDAGAIWNRTINNFQTGALGYERCDNDPCVYTKRLDDGSHVTMPLYVDDGKYYYDDTPAAKAATEEDMEKFGKRFEVNFKEKASGPPLAREAFLPLLHVAAQSADLTTST